MTRPLARLGIDELEALFETGKHDLPALKRLIDELTYRNVPRAIALLDKTQKVLKFVEAHRKESVSGTAPARGAQDLAGSTSPTQNGFEFDVPIFAPTKLPRRPPNIARIEAISSPEPIPITMSAEQAYRILKATSATSWDAIEFSRRQLVARAQPDRVAKLESAKRKALLDEAREANIAYKVLLQARS
jgi:hypothetical protein